MFLFQLPLLPELLLSMADFEVGPHPHLVPHRAPAPPSVPQAPLEDQERSRGWGAGVPSPRFGAGGRIQTLLVAPQLVKTFLTGPWTGIQNPARRLTEPELDAYLYGLSQPGGLTPPINYYRNIFG